MLHADGEELDLAPLPRLAELPRLMEQSRGTGLPVDFTVHGEPRPLPAGIELAVYRAVQEALTNTRKHAGAGSAASVELSYDEGTVTAEILDNGPGAGTRSGTGTGNGLAGLRARAAAYGGSFEARPITGGGFLVTARFPTRTAR